jgi:cyclic dehypoxanthinyl futalosine synthase
MISLAVPPPQYPHLDAIDAGLLAAVAQGEARLTADQALGVFHRLSLQDLGRYADARARSLHGDHIRTYIIDRNINYTNVCNAKCTFCAFRRDPDDADAYTLEPEAIHDKIAALEAIGGTQILMQGGMNPALPLDWYTNLLRGIKSRFPKIHIHAFSPPEFIEFVHFFNPPGSTLEDKIRWVMVRLRDAGLDSLPGGGGEIFAPHVRRKIGLGKCDAEAWLTCMYVAHTLGMFTSATMMFGHIEGFADRIHHMELVRRWQDKALLAADEHDRTDNRGVGHYKAFISWPFQRENTPLGRVKDWGAEPDELAPSAEFPGDAAARLDHALSPDDVAAAAPLFGRRVRLSSATDYLRTQALSRLYLDNIFSIGASWVTMGPHIGQVALQYGATDMGSVMMEENVVSSAGTTYCLDEAVLCRLIREAGFLPAQRNNTYDVLRVHAGPQSPDLAVTDWSTHRASKMHQEAPRPIGIKRVAKASLTVGATE